MHLSLISDRRFCVSLFWNFSIAGLDRSQTVLVLLMFSNVSHDFYQACNLTLLIMFSWPWKPLKKVNAYYASEASGYLDELSNTLPELVVCTNLQVRRGIGSAGKSRMEQSSDLFVRNMQKPQARQPVWPIAWWPVDLGQKVATLFGIWQGFVLVGRMMLSESARARRNARNADWRYFRIFIILIYNDIRKTCMYRYYMI